MTPLNTDTDRQRAKASSSLIAPAIPAIRLNKKFDNNPLFTPLGNLPSRTPKATSTIPYRHERPHFDYKGGATSQRLNSDSQSSGGSTSPQRWPGFNESTRFEDESRIL